MGPKITEKRRSRISKTSLNIEPAKRAPARSFFWVWLFLGAAALCFVVFGPALKGSFVFDDFHLPVNDPFAPTAPPQFWVGGSRAVTGATYWFNYSISGQDPLTYHVVNVMLHAIAGTIVFFLLGRILALAGVQSRGSKWWAFFGAAIFLVHPLQTESVDYISARSEVVCGLFLIAAWYVFVKNLELPTTALVAGKVLLLFAASVLGKENGVALPAMLLATDLYWGAGSIRARIVRHYKIYLPIFLFGCIGSVFILRRLATSTSVGAAAVGVNPFQYAITQCRVILLYVRLFFLPARQSADWQLAFFHTLTDNYAWVYVAGLLLLVAAAVWLFPRQRLISFGIAIFLVALAPTSSFIPIRDAMAERRMYVPIVGLILVVTGILMQAPLRKTTLAGVMAAVLLLLAWRSFDRSRIWNSEITLWQDAVDSDASNVRARLGLGAALLKAGECAEAVRQLKTIEGAPGWETMARWNLAVAYECNHQYPEALAVHRGLAAVNPSALVFNHIGVIEAGLGHADQALAAFDQALQLEPDNAQASAYRQALVAQMNQNRASTARPSPAAN